ncbi:uncharacterized protein LOC131892189 isoform X2 [Tigriopus californicus]|uniref:uncharacterized protein LOC131892189 isoform X2 n=1 Tax=Tigriopus californicus TaxID=6832 RepID=UPI0027D9D16F|nr:uncharacterized protein LOC131892189 isoform X2 [Tigriopus californicus]
MLDYFSVFVLAILTLSYVVGELVHFMPGVLSQQMSQDLHYGDQKCFSTNSQNATVCLKIQNESQCELENPTCEFIYSGQGIEYQVLAGPAFSIPFTCGSLIWGAIAGQGPRPRLVGICTLLFSVCSGLFGVSRAYWQLVVLRVLCAFGESGLRPLASSILPDLVKPERLGLANGCFSLGIMFGYGLSFAMGNYFSLVTSLGWRACFALSFIAGSIVGIALLFIKDFGEMRINETTALITQDDSKTTSKPLNCLSKFAEFKQTKMVLMLIAASLRQTGGESLSNNTQLYYDQYYPEVNPGLWLTTCSIVGGTSGLLLGGLLSDFAKRRMGIRARFWVLTASQLLSTPFAWAMLLLPPPWSYVALLLYYCLGKFDPMHSSTSKNNFRDINVLSFSAETWLAILFAILIELTKPRNRAMTSAIFVFAMNNLAGLLSLLVDPLSKILSFRLALMIMWPSFIILGGLTFGISTLVK